jgi:nicotinate-nucleotide adenylyltransferase
MQKIVLFGGVFDPIHTGHLSIYKAIQKQIKPQQFIVIPSKNPPLKSHLPSASPEQRLVMCKLFFKNFNNVHVSDYEILSKNKKTSYAIDTVKYFHKKYPHAQLFFAIGTDRLLDFKK